MVIRCFIQSIKTFAGNAGVEVLLHPVLTYDDNRKVLTPIQSASITLMMRPDVAEKLKAGDTYTLTLTPTEPTP